MSRREVYLLEEIESFIREVSNLVRPRLLIFDGRDLQPQRRLVDNGVDSDEIRSTFHFVEFDINFPKIADVEWI
jgi:hypothetical protein